jgi:hypothetical protein
MDDLGKMCVNFNELSRTRKDHLPDVVSGQAWTTTGIRPFMWTDGDGHSIPLEDIDDTYLLNIFRYIDKEIAEFVEAGYPETRIIPLQRTLEVIREEVKLRGLPEPPRTAAVSEENPAEARRVAKSLQEAMLNMLDQVLIRSTGSTNETTK